MSSVVKVSSLPLLEDKSYHISGNENIIYLIEDDCSILVEKDSVVKFLDTTKNKKIQLSSEINTTINYTVLESVNSNRAFDINGEINYLEISLLETNEKLNINLVSENSNALAKVLAISDNIKSTYIERIDHKIGLTSSDITNVGVSMNNGGITFDTTGKIDKGMAKSNCRQLSRGIVMDNNSYITAKPILLIDEFDCFANHGASIGKMSDEDLFYLMSRGLSKTDAFLLILNGIIKPFVDALPLEELKEKTLNNITNLIESD